MRIIILIILLGFGLNATGHTLENNKTLHSIQFINEKALPPSNTNQDTDEKIREELLSKFNIYLTESECPFYAVINFENKSSDTILVKGSFKNFFGKDFGNFLHVTPYRDDKVVYRKYLYETLSDSIEFGDGEYRGIRSGKYFAIPPYETLSFDFDASIYYGINNTDNHTYSIKIIFKCWVSFPVKGLCISPGIITNRVALKTRSDVGTNAVECNTSTPEIQFVPKDFHEVGLGFDTANICTPFIANDVYNEIRVNIPKKIIYNSRRDGFIPILPICAKYKVSDRRYFKYINDSEEVLHIKRVATGEVYSGGIVEEKVKEDSDKTSLGELIISTPPINREIPAIYKRKRRYKKALEESKKYSEVELDEGPCLVSNINLDLMRFVDLPLETGKYEVWLTCYGMESNHAVVEIVFE